MKYNQTNSCFIFELGKASQISQITNMTLTNYASTFNTSYSQTRIKLFNGKEYTDKKISYSSSN